MTTENEAIDLGSVRHALRHELAGLGHRLSADTADARRALYIMGDNDVAAAVFEVKPSADEAIYDLMLQGAWVTGMPPRFAVVPANTAGAESLETLEQMKAFPLLFELDHDEVTFPGLADTVARHIGLSRDG